MRLFTSNIIVIHVLLTGQLFLSVNVDWPGFDTHECWSCTICIFAT